MSQSVVHSIPIIPPEAVATASISTLTHALEVPSNMLETTSKSFQQFGMGGGP